MPRKQNKLKAFWSKKEKDLILDFPLGIRTSADAHWISGMFNKEFTDELVARGYDINTLKFEITAKPSARPDKFPALLAMETAE